MSNNKSNFTSEKLMSITKFERYVFVFVSGDSEFINKVAGPKDGNKTFPEVRVFLYDLAYFDEMVF